MKIQTRVSPQLTPHRTEDSLHPRRPTAGSTLDKFVSGRTDPEVQGAFRRQFGALAADPRKFHDTMQSIFGDSHDQKQAEAFRQRALKGDHGWLPPVKWV